jgi:heparan-alpha-glucosaminide N-acetyltransferase
MDRPDRVLSIDVLRGADVWLMLFVNEMAGVRGTPAFLRHVPPTADGMTITDVVFPAFLFITGMAIPFALGGRRRRGEARAAVWRHVLARTAILLAIGVLMINAEHASPHGILPPALWNVLMTVAVVLVWAVPEGADGRARTAWRIAGLVLLLTLVLVYRGEGVTGPVQIRPYWWGILGLIGWAYLVAAAVYLLAGDRPAVLVGAAALLYLVALADEADAIPALVAVRPLFRVGRVLGSHGALVLTGTLLTLALLRHREEDRAPDRFIAPALGFGLALAVAGLLLHSMHGLHPAFWISKVRATAAWCLLSAALTAWAWTAAYAAADVAGRRRWPPALTMAGENALMIYLLAPLLLSVFELLEWVAGRNPYDAIRSPLALGVVTSVVFAWVVVRLSGWMRARGLRLHL